MDYVLNGLVWCHWSGRIWTLLGSIADGIEYPDQDSVYEAGIEQLKIKFPEKVLPRK